MLNFKAKCVDARYEFEHLYLKEIMGNGYKQDGYDIYILHNGDWVEVDESTLVVINDFENKKRKITEYCNSYHDCSECLLCSDDICDFDDYWFVINSYETIKNTLTNM